MTQSFSTILHSSQGPRINEVKTDIALLSVHYQNRGFKSPVTDDLKARLLYSFKETQQDIKVFGEGRGADGTPNTSRAGLANFANSYGFLITLRPPPHPTPLRETTHTPAYTHSLTHTHTLLQGHRRCRPGGLFYRREGWCG